MKIHIDFDANIPVDLEFLMRMFGVSTLQTTQPPATEKETDKAAASLLAAADKAVRKDATEVNVVSALAKQAETVPSSPLSPLPKPTKKTAKKKKKEVEPEELSTPDVMPKKAEPNPATAVTVGSSSLTLKELRDAFAKYVKDTNLETASALLAKFEIKRVSDLEESRYVEFFEAIRGDD